MTQYPKDKVPAVLRHEPDSARPGKFCVLDRNGVVYAEGIPTEIAARVFTASPELLAGYRSLLNEAHLRFRDCWDLGPCSPDFDEFVDDDGELEEQYPGAPGHAAWLQGLRSPYDHLTGPFGVLHVEELEEPQFELF